MTTTTLTTVDQHVIIKTDSIGRIRISDEHRDQLLDSFEDSTMSAAKFAQLHGIKYTTFATWIQKRRKLDPCTKSSQPTQQPEDHSHAILQSLVELDLPKATHRETLLLELPSGIRVSIDNPQQAELAAILLHHLQSHQSC